LESKKSEAPVATTEADTDVGDPGNMTDRTETKDFGSTIKEENRKQDLEEVR